MKEFKTILMIMEELYEDAKELVDDNRWMIYLFNIFISLIIVFYAYLIFRHSL